MAAAVGATAAPLGAAKGVIGMFDVGSTTAAARDVIAGAVVLLAAAAAVSFASSWDVDGAIITNDMLVLISPASAVASDPFTAGVLGVT